MSPTFPPASATRAIARSLGASLACALACALLAPAAPAWARLSDRARAAAARPDISATLEQCVTAEAEAERSATFAGEMTAITGSVRMEMRIDVLERLPEEAFFHTVSAPGLGVWRASVPGVKVYKNLNRVTDLSAPASYRAAVRFRWLNAKGRLMKAEELRTPICEQPALPATP